MLGLDRRRSRPPRSQRPGRNRSHLANTATAGDIRCQADDLVHLDRPGNRPGPPRLIRQILIPRLRRASQRPPAAGGMAIRPTPAPRMAFINAVGDGLRRRISSVHHQPAHPRVSEQPVVADARPAAAAPPRIPPAAMPLVQRHAIELMAARGQPPPPVSPPLPPSGRPLKAFGNAANSGERDRRRPAHGHALEDAVAEPSWRSAGTGRYSTSAAGSPPSTGEMPHQRLGERIEGRARSSSTRILASARGLRVPPAPRRSTACHVPRPPPRQAR